MRKVGENVTQRGGRWVRNGLFAGGILFLGIGIARGEMAEVFLKATRICMECIGIG